MLQLENQTPFKTSMALLPDRAGIDTLYVVVKATVTLRPRLSLAKEQVPVTLADEYYGDPATSSVKYPSELHLGKAGTDVLLIGSAKAPGGRAVRQMPVTLSVADHRKTILVSGDRVWNRGKPSDPRPFDTMPLVWERAFGGVHTREERVLAEERNPVGCGFAGARSASEMHGQPVPNLEEPATPIQQLGDQPVPACFAPTASAWLPRRGYAGTYDDRWQRTRSPYLPDDFDPRFFQCACPEFAFDRYLQPGELVQVTGVTADGPIDFVLPDARLSIAVTIAGAVGHPPTHLETVLIEPDDNRICFTWRTSVPCDRRALKVEQIVIRRNEAES